MIFSPEELDQIEQIFRKVLKEELLNAEQSEYVTIDDIAHDVGYSREWVRNHPYCLPGPPDIDGKPKKWLRSKWDEYKTHMAENKRRWELKRVS